MTALMIFASTFILVFSLGFQSLNVNNGHYVAAFLTSFAIGIANLILFKTVPQADAMQIAAFVMGGPFGIITSMWAHRRWMKTPGKKISPKPWPDQPTKTEHGWKRHMDSIAPKKPACKKASPIPQPDGRRLCHKDCPKPLFVDDPYCDGSWKM